ncbi:MAG: beta-galactosidase, partial [Microlunatus sp.]|nr:beta-galactosidase [Microlunatus sp.]
ADIAEFHDHWLPARYHTITAFNARYQTSYTDFSQVPAAVTGQPLAAVYQQFRSWSVQDTYRRLTAQVRKLTDGPLYYYFGGHLANAPNYANNPDTFFALARQYDVTIIVDAAQSPGLALTFGSLARAYHVKIAQEWTAPEGPDALRAQAAQWVANYGMGLPEGGGEDFFIHDGTAKDVYGYPIYTSWLPVLKQLRGSYPEQPVALYADVSQGFGTGTDSINAGPNMADLESMITSTWNRYQAGFAVITSQEVANHAVDLSTFKAILPMNGIDENLSRYRAAGGTLLDNADQLSDVAPAYAVLSSAGLAQVVPTVAANGLSAQVVVAAVNQSYAYHGSVLLQPAGLNLRPGSYHVVDGQSGADLPQVVLADGSICLPAELASAQLDFWKVVPGADHGPGVQGQCPVPPGAGQTTVSVTAGQSGGGMIFLGLGQTNHGADGNLTAITQDGTPAVETWTSQQSGAPGSYVYLQVDPSSAVATAGTLDLTVTYWASDGQGFTPQYDAPGDPYHAGPSVISPGGGGWTTATVTLDGTQLSEAQNMGADLRLAARDSSQPLIIRSVTLSVG